MRKLSILAASTGFVATANNRIVGDGYPHYHSLDYAPPHRAMRVVARLSVDQVAGMLRRSPGAVRVLQHRGVKRLAERLAPTAVTP